MGVPAQRDAGVGVAQAGLHGLHVYPVGEQLGGLRVPKLVELEPLEAVLLRQTLRQCSKLSMRYLPPVSEQHTGGFSVCLTPILASSAACRSFHAARCDAVVASMASVRIPAWVLGVFTLRW